MVTDPSIYVWEGQRMKVIVPVFVDDVTILSPSTQKVNEVKALLKRHFKTRDLGPISFLLGIAITRDRPNRTIQLCQRQFIVDLLERFGMADCQPVTTPMTPGLRLSKDDAPKTCCLWYFTTATLQKRFEPKTFTYHIRQPHFHSLSGMLTTQPSFHIPISMRRGCYMHTPSLI